MALGSWLLAFACCVEAVENGHWGFPRPFFFLAFSRSLALQSTDFLEVGRRCVGAWGSPLLWCSLQASCSLRFSSFFPCSFSLFSCSSFFSSPFSPFSLSLLFASFSHGPLPYCTCSTQHSMYLSGCVNFASSRLWNCCRRPLIIFLSISYSLGPGAPWGLPCYIRFGRS